MTVVYGLLRYLGILWAATIIVYSLEIPLGSRVSLWLCTVLEVCECLVVFSLQGMIALRVYLFFTGIWRKRGVTLAVFGSGFLVPQTLNILASMMYVAASAGQTEDNVILGVEYCGDAFTLDALWKTTATVMFPLANFSLIAFELGMCVSAMYYAWTRLRSVLGPGRQRLRSSIVSVLVRDNLFYFLANVLLLFILVLQQVPSIQASIIWNNTSVVLQYLVYAMLGPWIILNLRKTQEELTKSETTSIHDWQMTTVDAISASFWPEPIGTIANSGVP
ncbi:hypothetical protein CONPUDRAFT_168940 [Coniophora puteana RWD-64-598 SS2]|uniref:Uncharacterized protein n=1 Tax=Coniophora puteana (strain RWD-64-598) TaxID=741705 RepID=A0A5M3MAT5_CONPW|nr:uncharacterized protein CONPUDRAFT_168940 [Coniophora puteana RWD-64-598 SS2]EIW76388.1 hypothetical protein CONPUDRAFT_168940 [Coniophora puteana RWD-64-598 SS2]